MTPLLKRGKTTIHLKNIAYFLVPALIFWILGTWFLRGDNGLELLKTFHINHSPFWDKVMSGITMVGEFGFIGPVLLLIMLIWYRTWSFFGLIVLTQLLPFLMNQALKFTFKHPRPHSLHGQESWFHHIEGVIMHNQLSFPSGHTAGAFAFFLLLSLLIPVRFKFWAVVFFLIALMVGISRIYLGQHFFKDIYAGSILGTFIPILICRMWHRFTHKPLVQH